MKVFYDGVGEINIESDISVKSLIFKNKRYEGSNNRFIIETLDVTLEHTVRIAEETYPIIMRGIVKTKWFEDRFTTNIKLGSFVENGSTFYRLWAPTSQACSVIINGITHEMERIDKGVFEYQDYRDNSGKPYIYALTRQSEKLLITDPYAKASTPNRGQSVTVSDSFLKHQGLRYIGNGNPIILETSVRDFSMDPDVPFVNRGKFLGLMESYGKYGFQHILDLGVTHVQLMPVNDFETVDETNPFDKYNWGYDTMQYMALEGSYSSDVHNPLQVILDFKKLVAYYHKNNIGVNIDVVFNHVYEVETHPLHQSVPYYFFRYAKDYTLSNGSFCGNEIASEMTMMRRLIVETCVYFVDVFDIDGLRFDLMGLLDIKTMNEVHTAVNGFGKPVMVYGEGWSMPTVLNPNYEASMKNAHKMPGIAHFNDKFRDFVGGKIDGTSLPLNEYDVTPLLTEEIIKESYKYIGKSHQSINYIECHDNYTFADRMALNHKNVDAAYLPLFFVLMSEGIPFLQIGQSFYRDKKGEENSYNLPDEINRIQWQKLDTYQELNEHVKTLIRSRRQKNDSQAVIINPMMGVMESESTLNQ